MTDPTPPTPPNPQPSASQPAPGSPDEPHCPTAASLTPTHPQSLEERIVYALQQIYDPEIPVNIHELGLIYDVDIQPQGKVVITMTLTSPACPVAQDLPIQVKSAIERLRDVTEAEIDLVWDPPWTPDRMSEAARLQLGLM